MPQTILILGASRGLGLEFARQYAQAGDSVYGTTRQGSAPIPISGVKTLHLDVTKESDFPRLAGELRAAGIVPDVLIHNAGINKHGTDSFEQATFDEWAEVLTVNTIGAVGTARHLVPLLPEHRGAKVVFLSSELGSIARSTGGFLPYRASKAALNMLVKCLSEEQARRGVGCLALHPGWVKTDMGGEMAPLEALDSVQRMRRTIAALDAVKHNGAFIDLDGKPLPY